jgi:hypothetical protein
MQRIFWHKILKMHLFYQQTTLSKLASKKEWLAVYEKSICPDIKQIYY